MDIPVPYSGKDKYVFISYSHRDTYQVFPIINCMVEKGYRVWFDAGIDPGTEWDENIAHHINECGYFVAFMSGNYLCSSNCKDELNYARDLEKERLIIYLEDVELPAGMAMRVNRLQSIYKFKYALESDFYDKLFTTNNIDTCRDRSFVPPVINVPQRPVNPAQPRQPIAPPVQPQIPTNPPVRPQTPTTPPVQQRQPVTPSPNIPGSVFPSAPTKKNSKTKPILIAIGIFLAITVFISFIVNVVLADDTSDEYYGTPSTGSTVNASANDVDSYNYILESNGNSYDKGINLTDSYYNSWAGISVNCPSGFTASTEDVLVSYSDDTTDCGTNFSATDDDSLSVYFYLDNSDMVTTEDFKSFSEAYMDVIKDTIINNIKESMGDTVANGLKFEKEYMPYKIAGETYLRADMKISGDTGAPWYYSMSCAARDGVLIMFEIVADSTNEIEDLLGCVKSYG